MALPLVLAVAGLALSGAATVAGVVSQERAAKKQRQAERLQARRARLQAVREARLARAQTLQAAENTGTGMSSGAAGAVGSIQAQLSSNLNFGNQLSRIQSSIARQNSITNIAGAVGQLGSTAASAAFMDWGKV